MCVFTRAKVGPAKIPRWGDETAFKRSFHNRIHCRCFKKHGNNSQGFKSAFDEKWSTASKQGWRTRATGRIHAVFTPTGTASSKTPLHSGLYADRSVDLFADAVGLSPWNLKKPGSRANAQPCTTYPKQHPTPGLGSKIPHRSLIKAGSLVKGKRGRRIRLYSLALIVSASRSTQLF